MPKNQRLLKGIVIFLGILIIAMVIIIIVASIMKHKDQKSAEAALVEKYQVEQALKQPIMQKNTGPFAMDLPLESGEEILSVQSEDKGIIITIGRQGRIIRIILVDYNANIIGTINVSRP